MCVDHICKYKILIVQCSRTFSEFEIQMESVRWIFYCIFYKAINSKTDELWTLNRTTKWALNWTLNMNMDYYTLCMENEISEDVDGENNLSPFTNKYFSKWPTDTQRTTIQNRKYNGILNKIKSFHRSTNRFRTPKRI